jgi:hypothetical protein
VYIDIKIKANKNERKRAGERREKETGKVRGRRGNENREKERDVE